MAPGPAALGELHPANKHVSLELDPFPVEPSSETLAWADSFITAQERLKQRTQLSYMDPDSWFTETVR